MRPSLSRLAIGVVCLTPTLLSGQAIVTLGGPTGELNEEVSAVTGLMELADGRVLLSDAVEKVVRVVDFSRGSARVVGRSGDGPREYRNPGRLFAWTGDSVALFDAVGDRLLIFDGTGVPVRTVPMSQLVGFSGRGRLRGDLRFLDRSGRSYTQAAAIPRVANGAMPPNTGPLLRFDPTARRVDTLAQLRLSDLKQQPADGGYSINLGAVANPFRTQDAWVAFADGRVAVLRATPYRLDWIDGNGRHRQGSAVAVTQVPVTAADRAVISEEGVNVGGSRLRVPMELLTDLPTTKPAFDHRTVIADPTGRVWVQRFRPAGDASPVYDVFDTSGALVQRVRVPIGSRIVGFGGRHLYLARTDDDGLSHLTRHARPM